MKQASQPKASALDLGRLVDDFRTLDARDPGMWPLLPRVVILVGLFAALLAAAWWFGWSNQLAELSAKQRQENRLKAEWLNKKKQAVNLDAYRQQLAEIDRSFGALLRQLPSKAEMPSLLVDINQAGLGRGLQFDLFKPGREVMKEFYAELPITIKVTGNYGDLGAFAGDVAKLSRIVTLNNIDIVADKDNKLVMTAVAKTFRYLDAQEIAAQRRAEAAARAKKRRRK